MDDFRQRCVGGSRLVGTFLEIPHPVAMEVTARAGPDFVCIDWEHAQIARDGIENLVRAADLHGVPALVRVPGHGEEAIAAALDSGARGILVPRVSSGPEALSCVRAARYPPEGERGVGPGRASAYGYRISDYLAEANAKVFVAVQVETAGALANVGEIAATDGVDVVFVGPAIFPYRSARSGRPAPAASTEAVEAIIAAALAAGKTAGIFCASPEDVARWAASGRQLLHPGQRHDVPGQRRCAACARTLQARSMERLLTLFRAETSLK